MCWGTLAPSTGQVKRSFCVNKNMYNSLKYQLLYVLHLFAHLLHLGLDLDHQ